MGGGGETQQTVQSTNSSSPAVTALTDKLANGVSGLVSTGSKVYGNPLYTGLSGTTQGGVNALASAGNNPQYNQNLNSTMNEFGAIASGQRFGEAAPGYSDLRSGVADRTLSTTNAAFNASGRFGGGANVNQANLGVGQAIAGLDYQNYQNDISRQQSAAAALPGLYSASLAPAQAQLAAGSILDADSLAKRQADAQLFDAQQNSGWNDYARASSILNGTAQAAGTTTTQTTPVAPWWQSALGYVAGNAGKAVGMM